MRMNIIDYIHIHAGTDVGKLEGDLEMVSGFYQLLS